MATNLTPPGDAVPARPFFSTETAIFAASLALLSRPVFLPGSRRYMMRTDQCFFPGPPSPFFTDALAVLPALPPPPITELSSR